MDALYTAEALATGAGRDGFAVSDDTSFAAERTRQADVLGDLVERHLDVGTLEQVLRNGVPADLPVLSSGLAGSRA